MGLVQTVNKPWKLQLLLDLEVSDGSAYHQTTQLSCGSIAYVPGHGRWRLAHAFFHVTLLQWPALKYCSPELPDIKKCAVFACHCIRVLMHNTQVFLHLTYVLNYINSRSVVGSSLQLVVLKVSCSTTLCILGRM